MEHKNGSIYRWTQPPCCMAHSTITHSCVLRAEETFLSEVGHLFRRIAVRGGWRPQQHFRFIFPSQNMVLVDFVRVKPQEDFNFCCTEEPFSRMSSAGAGGHRSKVKSLRPLDHLTLVFSSIQLYLYRVCWCFREAQSLTPNNQQWQENLPFNRNKP